MYLTKKLDIKNQHIRLLNIAPDYAIQKKLNSLPNIDYISIDLDSSLAMQKADLTNLTFEANSFDAIICYHVLEHIENDRKAISELFRVLKPKGWAIIQTPFERNREITFENPLIQSSKERIKLFGQGDHVRVYGSDYFERLEEVGFVVKEDDFINLFSEAEIQRQVLDKSELMCFCSKK